MAITDKIRKAEIAAVLLTALGKFLFMDYLGWRPPFIIIAIVSWTTYIVFRSRRDASLLTYWGFRSDNFAEVLKMILPYGAIALVGSIAIGAYRNTLQLTWHIIPILLLYPIWGTIQQFLLIALTAGNMQDMGEKRIHQNLNILFTAILFGAIHYPYVWLMVATFFLALFYGFIYLRKRNLYVLGLFHGWLGAVFYYTVLNRDPFLETFGRYLEQPQ